MAANWLHGWIQVIQVIGCDFDWFLPESAEMGDNDSWIWSNDFHKVDSDLSRHSPSFSLSSRHSQTFSSHHSPSFSSRIIHRLSSLASFTDFLLSHRSPSFSPRHSLSPLASSFTIFLPSSLSPLASFTDFLLSHRSPIHFLLSHRSPTFSSRIVHRLSPLASFRLPPLASFTDSSHTSHINTLYRLSLLVSFTEFLLSHSLNFSSRIIRQCSPVIIHTLSSTHFQPTDLFLFHIYLPANFMALGSALDYSTVIYLYKMKVVQLVQHVQCQFIGNFVFQSEDEEFVDDEFVDDEDVELFPDMMKHGDRSVLASAFKTSQIVSQILPGNLSYPCNWHIMKLQSCLKVHHVKSPFPMFMSQNKSKVQNQFKIDQDICC